MHKAVEDELQLFLEIKMGMVDRGADLSAFSQTRMSGRSDLPPSQAWMSKACK